MNILPHLPSFLREEMTIVKPKESNGKDQLADFFLQMKVKPSQAPQQMVNFAKFAPHKQPQVAKVPFIIAQP
jgi:hypothetical protein